MFKVIDQRQAAINLSTDLAKAFDKVRHGILLRILYSYGSRGHTSKFFRSHLPNRTRFKVISEAESVEFHKAQY